MKTFVWTVCLLLASLTVNAQTRYSQKMAESQGKQWTHGKSWDYVNGLVAKSLLNLCKQYQYADWTADYYQWAKDYADNAINPDGTFKNFKKGNIDNINSGKVLFALYRHEKTLDEKTQCRPLQDGCRLAPQLLGERLFAHPERRCQGLFLP